MKINLTPFRNAATLVVAVIWPLFAPISQAKTVTVQIDGDSFNPQTVTINAGDTVTWSGLANDHNVTGSTAADLDQFCGTSLNSFSTESSCAHTFTTVGTYPYECTIHASCCGMIGTVIVVAAAPTPSVSMTDPPKGAVFAAPATLNLAANASVSSGTVTNVTFFNGTASLGSTKMAPFSIAVSNLSPNTYSLTAVATAAGISATSQVVSLSVVLPAAISNFGSQITNGFFTFGYSANVGLSYVVQHSPDLVNWMPLMTNVASVSSMQATDIFVPSGQSFYRVMRQPNP